MGAKLSLRIKNSAFGECQLTCAVQQTTMADQVLSGLDNGTPHETGFHLDRDDAFELVDTAGGGCHDHVHEGHDRTTMGDIKRIEVLRLDWEMQYGLAIVKSFERDAQMFDEGNVCAKRNAHAKGLSLQPPLMALTPPSTAIH